MQNQAKYAKQSYFDNVPDRSVLYKSVGHPLERLRDLTCGQCKSLVIEITKKHPCRGQ